MKRLFQDGTDRYFSDTVVLIAFFCLLFTSSPCAADVVTDGSLGDQVDLDGPDYDITDDLGQIIGSNLFHSFEEFSILFGETAAFSGPDSVENIIARVTGGDPSLINGLLRSEIPGANLFLINPFGIMFGPNAVLDINGSFYAGTADYLRFEDGGIFHTDLDRQSVLSVARPEAFGFLTANPASILINDSRLEVPSGETFSLIGGDIDIQGTGAGALLDAPGGRLMIVGVGAMGEVNLNSPEVLNNTGEGAGNIRISNAGLFSNFKLAEANGDSGDIVIRGNSLEISNNSVLSAMTSGSGNGGTIDIRAGKILLDGSKVLSGAAGEGNSGDITIEAVKIILQNNARIRARSNGNGDGGDISIKASELTLIGNPGSEYFTEIATESLGAGDAGNIFIDVANTLSLLDGATISAGTFGSGNAGDILISAPTMLISGRGVQTPTNISSFSGPGATGHGGAIRLHDVKVLHLEGRALISASTLGEGNAGTINISAEEITMDGGDIKASTSGIGNGGSIRIDADNIELHGGAQISSSTTGSGEGGDIFIQSQTMGIYADSLISSDSIGSGNGGTLTLEFNGDLIIEGGMISTEAAADGDAGNINIAAVNIFLQGDAKISAYSSAKGKGGNINIDAISDIFSSNSTISTKATRSDGGNIRINAGKTVWLADSEIAASVDGGPETTGGNIDLQSRHVILKASHLTANAFEGHGGNIGISTDAYIADPYSIVDASSSLGIDGIVDIQAPISNLSGNLKPLPKEFLKAADLLKEPCEKRLRGGDYGSFIIKGHDALPIEPGTLQISPPLDL